MCFYFRLLEMSIGVDARVYPAHVIQATMSSSAMQSGLLCTRSTDASSSQCSDPFSLISDASYMFSTASVFFTAASIMLLTSTELK